MKYKDILLFIK